jgi:hypothetical protein
MQIRASRTIALLVLLVGAAISEASAWADPATPRTLTFDFTECTGPAGTPTELEAVKQPGGAAALHLTDGTGVFIAVRAVDAETGAELFSTPGFTENPLSTITCSLTNPTTGSNQLVTGLIVPPVGRPTTGRLASRS